MKQNAIKNCCACCCEISKDMVALNKKMFSRKITKFFCLTCLADFFGVTSDELLDKMQEFKDEGCILFK